MRQHNDQTDDATSDQTERESLARRKLLQFGGVAAAGAAAGAIAAAVNASPAAAAAGDPIIAGDPNDAGAGTTELTSTGGSGTLSLENSGTGRVILARGTNSANGSGVIDAFTAGTGRVITAHIDNESSTQAAITAWTLGSGPAISGLNENGSAGVYGETTFFGPGVLGTALASATGPAVQGTALGTGPGVRAVGKFVPAGTGVGSGNGLALEVFGRAAFTRSGLLTVPAGASDAFTGLVPGGLFASSRVLATIQENKGTVTVRAAVPITTAGPNKGRIRIILTGAVPTNPAGGLKVAWFVFG